MWIENSIQKNTKSEKVTEIAISDRFVVPEADITVTENMNVPELLHVDYSGERPVVSGRELHGALKVKTEYAKCLERMCEYGFTDGKDYSSFLTNRSDGKAGKPRTDHALTIPMAKELCMLQRNETDKFFRQYFIRIEELMQYMKDQRKRQESVSTITRNTLLKERTITKSSVLGCVRFSDRPSPMDLILKIRYQKWLRCETLSTLGFSICGLSRCGFCVTIKY